MTDEEIISCQNRCINNTGFSCGQDCDCPCHDAWEMCPRCHGKGRIDADPLNDHTHKMVECPMCGGIGVKEKDGYKVIIP